MESSLHVLTASQLRLVQDALPAKFNGQTRDVPWQSLYSSDEDGLSAARFELKVFNYRGPSTLLVEMVSGDKFALAVDEEWRESNQSWGGSDCCFMKVSPTFSDYPLPAKSIFYNAKEHHGVPKGILVGSLNAPLLRIDYDFSNVRQLQVYGCGSGQDYLAQQTVRKWAEQQALKHQRVPLPGKWEENPDRSLLEMAGVKAGNYATNGGCVNCGD